MSNAEQRAKRAIYQYNEFNKRLRAEIDALKSFINDFDTQLLTIETCLSVGGYHKMVTKQVQNTFMTFEAICDKTNTIMALLKKEDEFVQPTSAPEELANTLVAKVATTRKLIAEYEEINPGAHASNPGVVFKNMLHKKLAETLGNEQLINLYGYDKQDLLNAVSNADNLVYRNQYSRSLPKFVKEAEQMFPESDLPKSVKTTFVAKVKNALLFENKNDETLVVFGFDQSLYALDANMQIKTKQKIHIDWTKMPTLDFAVESISSGLTQIQSVKNDKRISYIAVKDLTDGIMNGYISDDEGNRKDLAASNRFRNEIAIVEKFEDFKFFTGMVAHKSNRFAVKVFLNDGRCSTWQEFTAIVVK